MGFLNICETIGTVAFAISGTMVGIRKRLDFYGIIMLAATTAVGGGMVRDVLVGNIPPKVLRHPVYLIISIISSVLVITFYRQVDKLPKHLRKVMFVFDAIGLAAFTAIGADVALRKGYESLFLVICLGIMTGTGGGVIRDILVNKVPVVLKKEIYAVASIIGGVVLYYFRDLLGENAAVYVSFAVTLIVRLIAIKYNIHLPSFKNNCTTAKD